MHGDKYIEFEDRAFVFFPSTMEHRRVAERLKMYGVVREVRSAGFVSGEVGNSLYTFGESISLGVKSVHHHLVISDLKVKAYKLAGYYNYFICTESLSPLLDEVSLDWKEAYGEPYAIVDNLIEMFN